MVWIYERTMKLLFALATLLFLCLAVTLHQSYTVRKDARADLERLKVAEDKATEQVMLQCREDVIRECETPRFPTHPLFGDFSPAFVDPFFNLMIESFLQVPHSLLEEGGQWVIISDHEPSLGDDREDEHVRVHVPMLRGNKVSSLIEKSGDIMSEEEEDMTPNRPQNLLMEEPVTAVSRRRLTEVIAATKHLHTQQQRNLSCCLEQAFRAQRVSLPCSDAINDLKSLQQVHLEKMVVFYRVQSSGLLNVLTMFAVASLTVICFVALNQRQAKTQDELYLFAFPAMKQPRRSMRTMAQGKLSVAPSWPSALALAAVYIVTVATIVRTVPLWLAIGFTLTTLPVFVLLVLPILICLSKQRSDCTCCCCGATSPDAKAGRLTEDQVCCSCCKGTGVCSIQCASCCGNGGCCGPDCCNAGEGCCSSGSGMKTQGDSSCCGCCCCSSAKQGDGCCCCCCCGGSCSKSSSKESVKQDCTCCCCGATSPDAKAGRLTEDQVCCSCCKGTGVCSIQCASCCGNGGCCGPDCCNGGGSCGSNCSSDDPEFDGKSSNEEESMMDEVVPIQIV